MGARILVAEDDHKQSELLRRYLEREGHAVAMARDGRTALDEARARRPDLVVLDVMMPRVDGLDVCRILRTESDVPIVMVTARTTEDDVLLGLDLGADDYLSKPYSPRELVARVRAVLRRHVGTTEQAPIRVGDIVVDPVRHEVRLAGALLDLTPAEFRLLECLASEPGRAFSRQRLLESVFGFDHYALERTVDVHVMNLRRKIEPDASRPVYITTVYGVGYKLSDAGVPAVVASEPGTEPRSGPASQSDTASGAMSDA